MIESVKLNHGMDYFYRLHRLRLGMLASNGLSTLQQYLSDVQQGCHEEIFKTGPRSSALKFDLHVPLTEVYGHKLSKLAEIAKANYNGTPHDKLQACALDEDPSSICTELPVWLKPADLVGMPVSQEILDIIFSEGGVLTGHIDLITIDEGKIWIWDFKPNARKEKYAATQVYFYALMLSKRTHLSLEKFRCGYFDENVAYLFKPELSFVE